MGKHLDHIRLVLIYRSTFGKNVKTRMMIGIGAGLYFGHFALLFFVEHSFCWLPY